MLDDFEINFLEEFSHITDCGTSVDKNHAAKDQLRIFWMLLKNYYV